MNKVTTMSFFKNEKCIAEHTIIGAIVRFGKRRKEWVVKSAFSENDDGTRMLLCLDEISSRENPGKQREISFPLKFASLVEGPRLELTLPKRAPITIDLPAVRKSEILAFAE